MRDLLLKTTNKGSLVCDMLSFSDNPAARLALKTLKGSMMRKHHEIWQFYDLEVY